MKEEDIAKCHFVPMSTMKRVLEYIENPTNINDNRCRRNLVHLQLPNSSYNLELKRKSWFHVYHLALRKAIYAHDWDQLAVLLKKSPIWEHSKRGRRYDDLSLYLRAFAIVLMNHPSAKAQGLLNDFLHMVLALRSDEDKKAVYKALLTLPDKIHSKTSTD